MAVCDSSTDVPVFRAKGNGLPIGLCLPYSGLLYGGGRHSLPNSMASSGDCTQALCDDFRRHLKGFYAHLKLAPPYDSIEKAITHLAALLKAMPLEEREQIRADSKKQWALYSQAFVESGLHQKHRGIIVGLIESRQTADLQDDYHHFLDAFRS